MSGLEFSLGLTVGAVLGLAAGGLLMWLRLDRLREDRAEETRLDQAWRIDPMERRRMFDDSLPKPLSPRTFDGMIVPTLRPEPYTPPVEIDWYRNEHPALSWGWWVEKAQRWATSVHVLLTVYHGLYLADERWVGRAPVPTARAVVEGRHRKGEVTEAIERILAEARQGVR